MVDVYCPHCGEELEITAKSGDTVRCAECERPFVMTNKLIKAHEQTKLQPEETTKARKGSGGIFIFIVLGLFVFSVMYDKDEPKNRDEKVETLFSGWDGSNKELVSYVKSNMKDPDSFEHVETRVRDKKGVVTAQMIYRGKNSFGATMTERVVADIDPATKQISNFKKLE